MKYLMVLIVFCFTNVVTNAQIILQGAIKNATSHEFLPFASVAIKGTAQGTVSNEQGRFSIDVKALPVILSVSCVGYQTATVTLSSAAPLTVQLTPENVQLQEVTISNPALTIMRRVAARALKESKDTYLLKVFFRQFSSEGNGPVFFSESFMDAKWQNKSFDQYQITNSRYLEANRSITYNNIAPFSLACSGYVSNNLVAYPVNHKPDSLYEFTLIEFFKTNGREIAVINCVPKNDDDKHTAFTGNYYVDTENYTVLKTDGFLVNVRMTASGPFRFKVKEIKVTSQYRPGADSSSVLDYVTFSFSSSLKAGFIDLKKSIYTTKLFTIAQDASIDPKTLKPVSMNHLQTDHDRFANAVYDAAFWKKNAIIKRTDNEDQAIEKLEKFKTVRGNLLDK